MRTVDPQKNPESLLPASQPGQYTLLAARIDTSLSSSLKTSFAPHATVITNLCIHRPTLIQSHQNYNIELMSATEYSPGSNSILSCVNIFLEDMKWAGNMSWIHVQSMISSFFRLALRTKVCGSTLTDQHQTLLTCILRMFFDEYYTQQ